MAEDLVLLTALLLLLPEDLTAEEVLAADVVALLALAEAVDFTIAELALAEFIPALFAPYP